MVLDQSCEVKENETNQTSAPGSLSYTVDLLVLFLHSLGVYMLPCYVYFRRHMTYTSVCHSSLSVPYEEQIAINKSSSLLMIIAQCSP